MHSHESNAAARSVKLIADLASRLHAAGDVAPVWPARHFDEVRNLAVEFCGHPPANLDKHLANSIRLILAVFGEDAANDMSAAINDASGCPHSLLAVKSYLVALSLVTSRNLVADALAAPHN